MTRIYKLLCSCRQPPSDFDMALSGTLLPSISTFASGAAVKNKPAGPANIVSIKLFSGDIECTYNITDLSRAPIMIRFMPEIWKLHCWIGYVIGCSYSCRNIAALTAAVGAYTMHRSASFGLAWHNRRILSSDKLIGLQVTISIRLMKL